MNFLGLGDNVVDCYLDQGLYYPGGNAVNVAVNAKRDGVDSVAYMGILGDDLESSHLQWALQQEDVSFERCRHVYARTAHPAVKLNEEGDRVFVGGPQDTAQHLFRIRLTKEDLQYIGGFDLCHTSCYSGIEPEVENLSKVVPVSFDFSNRHDEAYIRQIAPFLRMAFFSGSELTDSELAFILDTCTQAGVEVVGITRGSEGALFSVNGKEYRQKAKPLNQVVDTMGAGDSFIAAFLVRYFEKLSVEECLSYAAERAAATCQFYGAFGYPKPFEKGYKHA